MEVFKVFTQDRVQQRRFEQIVDNPVPVGGPQCYIVSAVQAVPSECIPERIVEQISVVPQTTEKSGPQFLEAVSPEQIMDSPVPQITEVVPSEWIMGVPVPQIIEDSLTVVPHERVQNHTSELIVGVPVPQLTEAPVDVMLPTPQECVQNRTSEQIVDPPVPQFMGGRLGNYACYTIGARAESHVGADCGLPCASEHGRLCGRVRAPPQERVQNRIPEPIMDVPVHHIKQDGLLVSSRARGVHWESVHCEAASS